MSYHYLQCQDENCGRITCIERREFENEARERDAELKRLGALLDKALSELKDIENIGCYGCSDYAGVAFENIRAARDGGKAT